MDPGQLSLSTYHNWLGNVDFDSMCKTYLGEENLYRTEPQYQNEDKKVGNWWEQDYKECPLSDLDPSESFYPNTHRRTGEHQLRCATTEITTVGNESNIHPYDLIDERRTLQNLDNLNSSYGIPEEDDDCSASGAFGFSTRMGDIRPLDSQYPERPGYGSAQGVKDSFGDLELEDVLHYLEIKDDDGAGSLGALEEPDLQNDVMLEDTADSNETSSSDALVKVPCSRKHRVRGPKNWEFLMRLLVDPRTNPSLIEWEDEERGIFRLRNPKVIAQIWASRNGGATDLCYNNFARGLRHHYKRGILIPIPEKQLVYQCGPQAMKFLEKIRHS